MSVLSVLGWGVLIGIWSAANARRKGLPHPSQANLALEIVKAAQKIRATRKLTGEGCAIRNEQVWTIGSIGTFKIVVEEEGADACPPN